MKKHWAEVDQSGKIEQLDTLTVVACANDVSVALCVKASEKRLLFFHLRNSIVPKTDRLPIIFAILIFLLLRTVNNIPSTIFIDEEYTGKNKLLIETLEKLLLRHSRGKWQGNIRIKQIGKNSPAHLLAWTLHKKKIKRKEMVRITASDIIRLWQ